MNEQKGNKATGDSKKLGADGLTKKERRALKVQVQNKQKPNAVSACNNIQLKNQSNSEPKSVLKENDIIPPKTIATVDSKSKTKLKPEEQESKLVEENSKDANNDETKLSKSELRAARRLMQEKQRQAKVASTKEKQNNVVKPVEIKVKDTIKPAVKTSTATKKLETVNKHQVQLFNHLYSKSKQDFDVDTNLKDIHPAFIKLGVQYLHKTILGSNARCLALLSALDSLVKDYEAPKNQEFCRSLESSLQNCVNYLQRCRPLAVSMTNAIRHFKLNLTQIDTNLLDSKKKAKLVDVLETYIHDEIEKAGEAISMKVQDKVTNGDVILTYGCSSLIKKILCDAHKEGKKFEVIVVDATPLLEGKEMLRCLTNLGIKCTYVLINALSFIMNRASKIMVGAHALLANGFVMSRTGTAQVALIAQAYNKPVLVCCETYKFSERVQADSFVYNEIGDPDELITVDRVEKSWLQNWKEGNNVTPLNLLYDVTPPDMVTAVITELGFLPCTSVPVVLRIKPNELN